MSQNARHVQQREQGFTLLEMLTVTTILGIVSAFAVPNLQGAKISSNESGVVGSLRSLGTATELWRTRFGAYPGAVTGDALGDLSDPTLQPAPYIDDVLGTGQKSGYTFTMVSTADSYACVANPNSAGSGFRSFYIDETGLIRVEADFATNGAASAASPPLD